MFLGISFVFVFFFGTFSLFFPRKAACSLHFGWIPCNFLRFP